MKKSLSLLLFVLIALGMSMPLHAGELKVKNGFSVKMFNGDRVNFPDNEYLGTQNYVTSVIESKGSYSSEPGFSINWWLEANNKGWGYTDTSEDSELNWKLLYGKWESERFSITAGYLDMLMGNGHNLQTDGHGGFLVDIKPTKATTITLLASLTDENGDDYNDDDYDEDGDAVSNDDAEALSDSSGEEDAWLYGIQMTQMFEGGKGGLYYLSWQDSVANTDINTAGVFGNLDFKGIALTGEAATFFGDNDGTDVSGLIATVGATAPISEAFTAEVNLYYAQGGADSEDSVYVAMEKRGMNQPMQKGLGPILNHDDANLQLIGKQNNFMSINSGGVIGATLSGNYKASQKTTLSAGIIYAIPEADEDDADWASLAKLNASVVYAVSKSLTLGVGASYLTFADSDTFYDDMWGSTVLMSWSF